MRQTQRERRVVTALLLTAGVLAVPTGAAQASDVEKTEKLPIFVEDVLEKKPSDSKDASVEEAEASEEATPEEAEVSEETTYEEIEASKEPVKTQKPEQEAALSQAVRVQEPPETVRAAAVVGGFLCDIDGNILKNRWIEYKGHHYYVNSAGYAYANQFISFGPKVSYYTDRKGRMQRGIQTIGENKYLLDEETAVLRRDNAFVQQSDGLYFPNAKGVLYLDQLVATGGKKYYVDGNGRKKTGMIKTGGHTYIFDESKNGALQMNGFIQYRNKTYYATAGGALAEKDLVLPNGDTVSVNTRTLEAKKIASKIKDSFSSLQEAARVARNQDVKVGDTHYFIDANGKVKNGTAFVGRTLYFYDPALGGARRTTAGSVDWNGKKYYVKRDGTVAKDEMVVISKKTYVASSSGVLRPSEAKLVLDLSKYQDPSLIDFDEIAKHVSGVVLRAGYTGWGSLKQYDDKAFDRLYTEFHKRGIPVGAYWYSVAMSPEDGVREATRFLQLIRDKTMELPLYWDTENEERQRALSRKQLTDAGVAFLETLENAGYYTGIYASTSWFNEKLDMERLKKYDVWVAHYDVSQPTYKGDYSMWQFTSKYRMPGYNGNLDANWVYVDYPTIIRRAGLNHL